MGPPEPPASVTQFPRVRAVLTTPKFGMRVQRVLLPSAAYPEVRCDSPAAAIGFLSPTEGFPVQGISRLSAGLMRMGPVVIANSCLRVRAATRSIWEATVVTYVRGRLAKHR